MPSKWLLVFTVMLQAEASRLQFHWCHPTLPSLSYILSFPVIKPFVTISSYLDISMLNALLILAFIWWWQPSLIWNDILLRARVRMSLERERNSGNISGEDCPNICILWECSKPILRLVVWSESLVVVVVVVCDARQCAVVCPGPGWPLVGSRHPASQSSVGQGQWRGTDSTVQWTRLADSQWLHTSNSTQLHTEIQPDKVSLLIVTALLSSLHCLLETAEHNCSIQWDSLSSCWVSLRQSNLGPVIKKWQLIF